jgi:hypothetical protein
MDMTNRERAEQAVLATERAIIIGERPLAVDLIEAELNLAESRGKVQALDQVEGIFNRQAPVFEAIQRMPPPSRVPEVPE